MTQAEEATERDGVATASEDLVAQRLAWLAELFPEAFPDGALDLDRLRLALGDAGEERGERFTFTWAGKREAIQLLQVASRATLAPDPDQSREWETTQNVFIEGDNLEVLKLLYKSYFGRVKMIYIDPPYNTGNDFVYRDSFADPLDSYLKMTEQRDEEGNLLTSNPETSGRYHSAWLSMMYPRLFLARQLLREDGVIFISIDDHEAHNLRLVMNEIFGEENFIGQLAVQLNPRGRHLNRFLANTHEYVLVFARDATQQVMYQLEKDERMAKEYRHEDDRGRYRELELRNRNPAFNKKTRPKLYYPIYVEPESGDVSLEADAQHTVEVFPRNKKGEDSCWTWGKAKFAQDKALLVGKQTQEGGWRIFRKDYLVSAEGDAATTLPKSLWTDKEINNDYGKKAVQDLFDGVNVFDFPKSPALIEKMVRIGTRDGDLVLDFFAGSGTTAQAVMNVNREDGGGRNFVLVQLPEQTPADSAARELGFEDLAALARERVKRAAEKLNGEDGNGDDLGFRAFKLAASNYRPWPAAEGLDPQEYTEQMALYVDRLVDGWNATGVIWEAALKEGFSLTSRLEVVDDDKQLFRVTDDETEQSFLICLSDELDDGRVRELNLTREDLFICLDRALNDARAANLALQCRLKTV